MARFVLLLLLVITGALVMALAFDHKGRRDARFIRLRSAFLHGTPLAGYTRAAALAEFVHPGGVRFRAPASWTIEILEGERAGSKAVDGVRRVQVELLRLEGPASGSVIEVLQSLAADGERSIETLANGNALMKSVDPVRDPAGLLASYTWRLGRTLPHGGLQIAVFRLRMSAEAADDVIAQSDLAMLDRQVREATLSEPPPSPSAGA